MFSILVVEDNADMRELFCTVLTDGGYRAIPAADGQEALEVMERQYIDLIAADVMMPRMDGYELTRELRSTSKKTGGLPHLQALSVTFGDSSPGGRARTVKKVCKPFFDNLRNGAGIISRLHSCYAVFRVRRVTVLPWSPRSRGAWRRSPPGTWPPGPRRCGCGRTRCPPPYPGRPPPA